MPIFLSALRLVRKGGIAMNELLTWGVPITLIGICIGGAFAALQLNEVGPDEFWISRGCFVLAALIGISRVVLWEATTSRALLTRIIVAGIALGVMMPLTVEAVRYVNRKQSRWVEVHQPPELVPPSPPSTPTVLNDPKKSEPSQETPRPNLVFKDVEFVVAHSLWGYPLAEGRNTSPHNFDPDVLAVTIKFENEFNHLFKVIGVGNVTAQLFYQFKNGGVVTVNRGAWLNNGNRIDFGVNEFRRLIVAVVTGGHDPFVVAICKEYTTRHGGLEAVARELSDDFYNLRVRLISEQSGATFLEKEFTLEITRKPELLVELHPTEDLSSNEIRQRLEGFLSEGNEILSLYPKEREHSPSDDEMVDKFERRVANFLCRYPDRFSVAVFLSDIPTVRYSGGAHAWNWPTLNRLTTRIARLKDIVDEARKA